MAGLGVFYRGDRGEKAAIDAKKAEMEASGAKITLVRNEVVDISSTDLRRMLVFECADSFLPDGVGDYIRQQSLYGTKADLKKLTVDELRCVALSYLKPKRMAHVLGTEEEAIRLARRYGVDEQEARTAALLHDCTKKLGLDEQLALCE